jgi:hypothetical protein
MNIFSKLRQSFVEVPIASSFKASYFDVVDITSA